MIYVSTIKMFSILKSCNFFRILKPFHIYFFHLIWLFDGEFLFLLTSIDNGHETFEDSILGQLFQR